jgi:hypothetical protein
VFVPDTLASFRGCPERPRPTQIDPTLLWVRFVNCQYGEFRKGFQVQNGKHDQDDTRLIFYGIRYIVETFLCKKWTQQEVDNADKFYS